MRAVGSKHAILLIFAGVMGTILIIRLFVMTVFQYEKWNDYTEEVSQRILYETAPRGDILDRNGNLLATSKAVYSVTLSRVGLTEEKALEAASKVIKILEDEGEDVGITQNELKLSINDNGYESYMPVILAEDISRTIADRIQTAEINGVCICKNYKRVYPEKETASHVLGYLGRISEEEYENEEGYRNDSLIGKDGIEKSFEKQLKGVDSMRILQVDSQGNVKKELDEIEGNKGQDIQLTVDLELQKTTEAALEQAIIKASEGGTFDSKYGECNMVYAEKAKSGAAVAIEVKTGKVLALASYPDYDPNIFTGELSQEEWENLQQENPYDPMSPAPLYNLATMAAVQPGSTFKPVTALAALSNGLDKKRLLYDRGAIDLGGTSYGCFLWNESGETHGYVDLKKALKVSCNYYFYDIASGRDFSSDLSLNYDECCTDILEFAKSLGLGRKTGIEINETEGNIPSEQLKLEGIKASLQNYLLRESEYYFKDEIIKNRAEIRKNIEKIKNWTDYYLTLEEIIGKLKSADFVKEDKIVELAEVCKYDYFDQKGLKQGDIFNISIGQGDNAYTTLQMAGYMAALGRGGSWMPLTLIENSTKNQNNVTAIKENDVKYIIDCLSSVTNEEGGSLYSVFAGFPYIVAAKTGTAQKSGYINKESEQSYLKKYLHLIAPDVSYEEMMQEAKRLQTDYPDVYENEDTASRKAVINLSNLNIGYEDIDKYKETYDNFAWTVALAPAENPQIAVAVMLVQGKTSFNAAPAVREIIGKYGDITGWEKSF